MATTSRDPDAVKAKITRAVQARELKKALSLGRDLIKLPRASVDDCLGLVPLAKQCHDRQLVLLALRRAVKRSDGDVALMMKLSEEEFYAGHTELALTLLEQVQSRADDAVVLQTLGVLYGRMGEPDPALTAFRRAAELDPDNAETLANLAAALGFEGKVEDAEAICNRLISTGRAPARVWFNRSALRRQTKENNHVEDLTAAIKAAAHGADASYLHYALAKELEDLGAYDQSGECVQRAGAERRAVLSYSAEAERAEFDRIKTAYDETFFAEAGEGYANEEPIFILGMPRSGSTLIERFVSAHSQVFAAGELQNFKRAIRNLTSDIALNRGLVGDVDRVALSLQIKPETLGKAYVESTRPRTGHVPRFIDKNPSNYINLGLIAAALPRARIIYSARDPMDVCYAMFKQPFQDTYRFTYDLQELARFYLGFEDLMSHWSSVLPGRIIRVQYEELVSDSSRVVRNLIAQLDLPWEDVCLDHRANPAAALTASAAQVRQPIYNSSVGKWRRFEKQLEPLQKALEAGGIGAGSSISH